MFITDEIREHEGKFIQATERAMTNLGIARMGMCDACGHVIKNHYGVKYPDQDKYMWVGSRCVDTLTRDTRGQQIDVPPGTRYSVDGREYIAPAADWIKRIDDWNTLSRYSSGLTRHYRNQFVHSVLTQAREYSRLTIRQYDAVNRIVD